MLLEGAEAPFTYTVRASSVLCGPCVALHRSTTPVAHSWTLGGRARGEGRWTHDKGYCWHRSRGKGRPPLDLEGRLDRHCKKVTLRWRGHLKDRGHGRGRCWLGWKRDWRVESRHVHCRHATQVAPASFYHLVDLRLLQAVCRACQILQPLPVIPDMLLCLEIDIQVASALHLFL